MTPRWRTGNQVELLENGDEFFPRIFQAIEQAHHEVILETFILCEDKVGQELAQVLIRAAERGVRVELTVDAWGSMELSDAFIGAMTRGGVCVHLFEERRPRWRMKVSWFRRLHRKLIVVDGKIAFVGGINFSEDHLTDYGPAAKQDYSVMISGPTVRDIHAFALESIESVHRHDNHLPELRRLSAEHHRQSSGSMQVMFVSRDNLRGRRTAIEKHYRAAVRTAQRRLIIANAYFFPGYLLLHDIRNAARRGVDVRLIMQADPDIPIAKFGATLLYDYLLEGGVRIYEYGTRQFHGKVALIDDDWTTVGSSNLDPLSLWFNLEANVVIRDQMFNRTVSERIERLIQAGCTEIDPEQAAHRVFWRPVIGFVAFHFLRRFPRLAGLLPAHRPRLTRVLAPEADTLDHEAA